MNDAYTIGITVALENGVSAGAAAIRGDLEGLDRVIATTLSELGKLQAAAGGLRLGTAPAARAMLPPPTPATQMAEPEISAKALAGGPARPTMAATAGAPAPIATTAVPAERPKAPSPLASTSDKPSARRQPATTAPVALRGPAVPVVGEVVKPPSPAKAPPSERRAAPTAAVLPRVTIEHAATPAVPAAPVSAVTATARNARVASAEMPATTPTAVPLQAAPAAPAVTRAAPVQLVTGYDQRPPLPSGPTAPAFPRAPRPAAPRPLAIRATGMAPATAAPGVPAPREQREDTRAGEGRNQGQLHIDGAALGRWVADHLAREAGQPPFAYTGFDGRLGRSWPGAFAGR